MPGVSGDGNSLVVVEYSAHRTRLSRGKLQKIPVPGPPFRRQAPSSRSAGGGRGKEKTRRQVASGFRCAVGLAFC